MLCRCSKWNMWVDMLSKRTDFFCRAFKPASIIILKMTVDRTVSKRRRCLTVLLPSTIVLSGQGLAHPGVTCVVDWTQRTNYLSWCELRGWLDVKNQLSILVWPAWLTGRKEPIIYPGVTSVVDWIKRTNYLSGCDQRGWLDVKNQLSIRVWPAWLTG